VIDFAEVARSASLPDIAMRAGVALKPNGKEYEGLCPVHNERTPSLRIYQKTDGWRCYCFGCGFNGNALDFCQEVYGIDVKEAAKLIAGESVGSARTPVEPLKPVMGHYDHLQIGRPPDGAYRFKIGEKSERIYNAKRDKFVHYTPTMVHNITDKHDMLLGHVLRIEIDGKKLTPSIFWALDKNTGKEFWANMPYPGKRPLYGLGKLYQYPERQVIICEGEKTRDAADRLLGNKLVAVSWIGGTNAVSKAYWQSLAGKSCIIFPDHDDVGRLAAFAVCEALKPLGCTIKIVEIQDIDIPEGIEKRGYDLADTEHLGQQWISDLIRKRIEIVHSS
jgi:hypothetical protein